MTYTCKGFIANSNLVDNTEKKIAVFGELSLHCRTFALDTQQLSETTTPDLSVLVFSNKDSVTDKEQQVHHTYQAQMLEFARWLYETSSTFTSRTTQQDVVAAIANRFEARVSEIVVDPLRYDTVRYLPTRVSYKLHVNSMPDMQLTLWLSNDEFETGYDLWTNRVVSPVTNVDILLGSYAAVTDALKDNNSVRDFQRVEAATGKIPGTSVVPVEVTWIDPSNSNQTLTMVWYVINNGPRGAATDIVQADVVKYILEHSAQPESNWRLVLPDLFRITRFYMVPQWDKGSINGRGSSPALYSPFAGYQAIEVARAEADAIDGGDKFVITDYETFNHPYRSLAICSFPGTENRADAKRLYQRFPDYIAAEGLHEDFDRQQESTKQFSNMLTRLIIAAEAYKPGVTYEAGMRLVKLGDVFCIATKLDNIEFLMKTKVQA